VIKSQNEDDELVANGVSGAGTGVHITGGFLDMRNFHCELMLQGVLVDIPTALTNGLVAVHNGPATARAPTS